MTMTRVEIDQMRQRRLAIIAKRQQTMARNGTHLSFNAGSVPQVRMIVSPWFIDTDGLQTRTVRAAE